MLLVQFLTENFESRVGILNHAEGTIAVLEGTESTHQLALDAIAEERSLIGIAEERTSNEKVGYAAVFSQGRLLPPLTHPDPAHCLVTGTGLTHLGSAGARDQMHIKTSDEEENLSDSIKMFRMGVEGGKPKGDAPGVQPEWFYKGDGTCLSPPGGPLPMPAFALHMGEETEVVGLYVIAPDGTPHRVGYCLGNESSDHVMEKQNYLYLAHSKLRACAVGPAVLAGDLPADVRGQTKVIRDGKVIWEKEFLSGEENMSHWLRNLEHHHFKYEMFRRPGDVHVHFFGAATLCFSDGVLAEPGDVFEIDCPIFGPPLVNRIKRAPEKDIRIRGL